MACVLLLGGRGSGKTRAAAEWVTAEVMAGRARHVAVVARTSADVRDVCVEGPSGLLVVAPDFFRPTHEPSRRRLTWPNGSQATTFSADEPDLLRGPQHALAWCDELAAWPQARETWNTLMLGLRLGQARCVVSTTPRPILLIRDLVSRDGRDVRVSRMTTFENLANLSPAFAEDIVSQYAGTTIGRQELHAEILVDVAGALWTRGMIEQARVSVLPPASPPVPVRPPAPVGYWERIEASRMPLLPQGEYPMAPQAPRSPETAGLARIVVAVDPSVSATSEGAAECGIIVAGVDRQKPPHGYVFEDASVRTSPDAWARRAVKAYHRWGADRVMVEVNQGGALVPPMLRTVDPNAPIRIVYASRGKQARAEPIAALYEQQRVHHVGVFPALEEQMCSWIPGEGESPDRVDALTWALTALVLTSRRRLEDMSPQERESYFARQRALLADSRLFRI